MLGVRHFIERGHADAITGAIICEPQDGLICTTPKGRFKGRIYHPWPYEPWRHAAIRPEYRSGSGKIDKRSA